MTRTGDYELDITAHGASLVVSLRGRITAEARRHLNDVVRAAQKCGVPVELTMPGTKRRFKRTVEGPLVP